MNNIKSFILILLLTAVLLCGCGDKILPAAAESPAASPQAVVTPTVAPSASEAYPDNVITRNVPGEIQFDFDEALKNIYLAGRKVSFPKTVADLGEGFSLQNLPLDNKNGSITDGLLYSGQEVANVFLVNCTVNEYDINSEVATVSLSILNDNEEQQGIYKFRIDDKVTREDIIAFFGQPTIEKEYNTGIDLYYEQVKPKKRYIRFNIVNDSMYEGLQKILIVSNNVFNSEAE